MESRRIIKRVEPYLYISPALFALFIILVYPLGYSFWLSFHDWTIQTFRKGVHFVGFDNFINLITNPEFLHSLLVTFKFMAFVISLEFILGMILALLMNEDIKGRNFFRAMILLPMMCTNVVIGVTWRLLYNHEFGILNYYLVNWGFQAVPWLSQPTTAFISLVITDVWNTTSFVALLLLAGLQSLPSEPYEAAKIDGATRWQTFRYLTLPLLRPTILVVLIWRMIDTFRIFDVPYLLTAGGPGRATETVSIYIYRYGFQSFNLSFASAASFIMIIIMMFIAGGFIKIIGVRQI